MNRVLAVIALAAVNFGCLALSVRPAFAQTAVPEAFSFPQYLDNSGNPVALGFICSYAGGTTNLLHTYTDTVSSVDNQNPVRLNASGRPINGASLVSVDLLFGLSYKLILYGAGTGNTCNGVDVGTQIRSVDHISSPLSSVLGTSTHVAIFGGPGLIDGKLTDNGTTVAYPDWTVATSPAFKINQAGSTGDHGTHQPTGSDFRPMLTLDLSNPTNTAGGKQGLYINTKMKTSSGTRNSTGLWVDSYFLDDSGGDVSGIHVVNTGSGDALSLYHLAAERPAGYALPCATCGFGLEIGVDHGDGLRIVMQDNATDSVPFQGRGISILDQATTTGFADILIAPVTPGNGVGRYAMMVNNSIGSDVRFSVALDTGATVIKDGLFISNGNLEVTNTHGLFWDLPSAAQAFATATATGQVEFVGGDGVGSGGTIATNFENQSRTSVLQVLTAGGVAIPATTNQITIGGLSGHVELLTWPAPAGNMTMTFPNVGSHVQYMEDSDGRMFGWGLSSSDLGGNNLWLNSAIIGVVTASTNASFTLMSNIAGFGRLTSGHSGSGTTNPIGLFVDATNILKGETSGTDRTCIYINGALRILTLSGGAVIDGGACP